MNNQQFTVLRKKIAKFERLSNMALWHGGVVGVLRHRFSLHKSQIEFSIRHIQIPFPSDVFILSSNNDLVLVASRTPNEVEDWGVTPSDLYEWVTGESVLFDLRWGEIVQVPKSLVEPVLDIFKTYYGTSIDVPVVTIGTASRLPYKTHNSKTVFAPNPNLFPQEQDWVVEFQTAKIEGREIPDRPEFTLGERLQKAGLYDGLEWGGLE